MNDAFPAQLAPLYAAIGAFRLEKSGKVVETSLEESVQLAHSLHLLGLDAQLVVANVLISKKGAEKTKFIDVGVWDRAPVFDPHRRQYSGHVFIWSEQYRRLIDVSIPHYAVSVGAVEASASWDLSLPVVLEMPVALPLYRTRPTTFRSGRAISYNLMTGDPDGLAGFFRGENEVSDMLNSSFRIASGALRALRMAEIENAARWKQRSPAIRALLDDRTTTFSAGMSYERLLRAPYWQGSDV